LTISQVKNGWTFSLLTPKKPCWRHQAIQNMKYKCETPKTHNVFLKSHLLHFCRQSAKKKELNLNILDPAAVLQCCSCIAKSPKLLIMI